MSNLYRFPEDFLRSTAIKHGLSDLESEVFQMRFREGLNNTEITRRHGLPKDTLHKRFGEIYKKYGVIGKGRGKDQDLNRELDKEFSRFRHEAAQARELSVLSQERENDSLRHEIDKLWEAFNQFQESIDSSPGLDAGYELSSFSGNIESLIDDYIERLKSQNNSTKKILAGFFGQAPVILERLAMNSHLKERDIAILLLEFCKNFIREIEGMPENEAKSISSFSIEVFPSSEENIDPV